jgi:ubiquitin thioesterase OTU1
MSSLRLRVRTPAGESLQITDLNSNSTLADLQKLLQTKTNILQSQQELLIGFPPKPIDIQNNTQKLVAFGIKNGEQIILKKSGTQTGIIKGISTGPYVPISDRKGHFVRRIIPGDNSCLFHACAYVLHDKSRSKGRDLRQLCANIVQENPKVYNNAFLGQPNLMYVQWIMDKDTWGGAIELSILSDHYKTEIVAFDTTTMREDHYGENNDYSTRVLIIYTGNHYDALALAEHGGAPESHDQVIFNSRDENIMKKAREYVFEEHRKYLSGGS